MRQEPLVSIITPSYNQGNFIEDTLLSVKNQVHWRKEHIVVDGCSTDNTLEILKKYKNEYDLKWISEPDRGQTEAINKGLNMASGEIIGWLNSDDTYFSIETLTYIVNAFRSDDSIDVVYGNTVWIDHNNSILYLEKVNPFITYKGLLRRNWLRQPSVFWRSRVTEEDRLDENFSYSMDYELWVRLMRNGRKFRYMNRYLSCCRLHPSCKTALHESMQLEEEEITRKKYGCSLCLKDRFLFVFDTFLEDILLLYSLFQLPEIYRKQIEFAFHVELKIVSGLILSQLPYPSRLQRIKKSMTSSLATYVQKDLQK